MGWTCGRCGRIAADGADWCEKCGIGRYGGSAPGYFEPWIPKQAPGVTNGGAAYGDHAFVDDNRIGETSRYEESYRMARIVDRIGVVIIVLGLLLGLIVAAAHVPRSSYDGAGFAALGILAAFIQIIVTCITGYVVRAVAAILRNTTDAAVQTSPLLTTAERVALLRSRE